MLFETCFTKLARCIL